MDITHGHILYIYIYIHVHSIPILKIQSLIFNFGLPPNLKPCQRAPDPASKEPTFGKTKAARLGKLPRTEVLSLILTQVSLTKAPPLQYHQLGDSITRLPFAKIFPSVNPRHFQADPPLLKCSQNSCRTKHFQAVLSTCKQEAVWKLATGG